MVKEMGAKHRFRILPEDEVSTVVTKVINTLGSAPDRTIECSGAQFSVDLGIAATKKGGVFGIVGQGPERISFPVITLLTKELEEVGSFRYANTWRPATEMVASGRINLRTLASQIFSLKDVLKALTTARSGEGVNVMVDGSI